MGVAGRLTRVDFGVEAYTGDVVIRAVDDDGAPTGPDLASGLAVMDGAWAVVELSPALEVAPGDQLAMLTSPFTAQTIARFSSYDPYPGGKGVQRYNSPTWEVVDASDVVFRTWVDADEAPTLAGDPPTAVVGEPYDFAFDVTGNPEATVEVTDGDLPDGLTLDEDGVLAGTPTEPGTFPLTLTASNGVGDDAVLAVELTVHAAPSLTGDPAEATVGEEYTYAFDVDGFPTPVVTTDSVLPDGLTLGDDGVLAGTPTESGTFPVTLTASNGVGEDAVLAVDLVVGAAQVDDPPATEPTDEPTDEPEPTTDPDPVDGDNDDQGPARPDDSAPEDEGVLADTGSDPRPLIGLAVLALLGGALLVGAARAGLRPSRG